MVSVNASEIELNSRRYAIWGKLKINATVTEAGTGKAYIECKCTLRNHNE